MDAGERTEVRSVAGVFGRDRETEMMSVILAALGEAFQKRDSLRLLAGRRRAQAFAVRREAVSIDDDRATLAFADMTADSERLAEGFPHQAFQIAVP